MLFGTPVTLTGPVRAPRQMLDDQEYDGHASVHDATTAASLGLRGAPIEGPTHFSQFDPLAGVLWGPAWFERGCVSAHFQNMVVEGEQVVATLRATPEGARIEAHKTDGDGQATASVLQGSASLGPAHPITELERRRSGQSDPGELFIVDRLRVGMRTTGDTVSIDHDSGNGPLYPFSLAQKLACITEPHPWYTPDGGASSPWGRAIVPMEMISVLAHKDGNGFPVRTPSLGLFLDLEVRLLQGPVFVGQRYRTDHEVLALGQSRKTESYWTRTTLSDEETGQPVAIVDLHSGVFKTSYAAYPQERLA